MEPSKYPQTSDLRNVVDQIERVVQKVRPLIRSVRLRKRLGWITTACLELGYELEATINAIMEMELSVHAERRAMQNQPGAVEESASAKVSQEPAAAPMIWRVSTPVARPGPNAPGRTEWGRQGYAPTRSGPSIVRSQEPATGPRGPIATDQRHHLP